MQASEAAWFSFSVLNWWLCVLTVVRYSQLNWNFSFLPGKIFFKWTWKCNEQCVDPRTKHNVHGIGEKWISCLHQHIPLSCYEIHIICVCVCMTFTQWVEINNQICTSFLIKSTSFLSLQMLARCLCGIHLAALSILHSHPFPQSPDTPAFCSWSANRCNGKPGWWAL